MQLMGFALALAALVVMGYVLLRYFGPADRNEKPLYEQLAALLELIKQAQSKLTGDPRHHAAWYAIKAAQEQFEEAIMLAGKDDLEYARRVANAGILHAQKALRQLDQSTRGETCSS